jgi:ParB-like chromosome segregation protein Spo0J
MITREFHPLAEVFPMIEGVRFKELVADIKANGLLDPITLCGGKILDGRNRYRACREAGIECATVELSPDTDPVVFVISKNLQRRDLTAGQRAMAAAKLCNLRLGQRADLKRKKEEDIDASISSAVKQEDAARLMGVSQCSVSFANQILRNGTPQDIADVESGKRKLRAVRGDAPKRKKKDRNRHGRTEGEEQRNQNLRLRAKLCKSDLLKNPTPLSKKSTPKFLGHASLPRPYLKRPWLRRAQE